MGENHSTKNLILSYGDLLFDLCESVLWNPLQAQATCRAILSKLSYRIKFQKYKQYERSWILKIACQKLLHQAQYYGHLITPEKSMKRDKTESVSGRLENFNAYFHRLSAKDQILLILKDKYDIPYTEIAAALSIPAGSLKVRRQQALKTLEEWLWNNR